MPLIPANFEVQIGLETTWGTAVTPTAKLGLVESCTITPEIAVEFFKEQRGSLAPAFVSELMGTWGGAKIVGVMSYQDAPYFLDGIMGKATPSGAGPYVYAHSAPAGSTLPDRRIFTIVRKQAGAINALAGATLTELNLSLEARGALKYEATFIGKSVSAVSGASLSDRTQTPIVAPQGALYIDAGGGTIGTTQITNPAFFAWECNIKTNADLYPTIGSLAPKGYREASWEVSEMLSLEVHSDTTAYLTAMLSAVTAKLIRVKATSGTSIAQFDFAGAFSKAPELHTDADGVSTFDFELSGQYDSSLANFFKSSITNSVSSLP